MKLRAVSYAWRLFIIAGTTLLLILLPIQFNFEIYEDGSVKILTFIFLLFFLIDFVYSLKHYSKFHTHFLHRRHNYLRFFLIFDLLSLLPILFVFSNIDFSLFFLFKLFKVAFYFNEMKQIHVRYSDFIAIILVLYWMATAAHILSSIWLLLHHIDPALSNSENYITSLYWIVTTLTTVGFGDIIPVGNSQMIFTILVEIMGVGFYGFIIGKVVTILSNRDPLKIKYLENLDNLASLSRTRKISSDLQKRIRDYFEYVYTHKMSYDESEFLHSLPPSLEKEVSRFLKKEVLEKVSLFENAPEAFIDSIAVNLQPVVLTPNDILFHFGEIGKEMFFVLHGSLKVLDKDGKILSELKDGDYFGEIALIKNQPRIATVQAIEYCDLYSLNKNAFDSIVFRFPEIAEKINNKINLLETKNKLS
ncbi:MAG: hypothetical protein C4543_01635 [Ignavibacteriales bacterium]|nr:MAG: hypothetical protein C4543_01635 [Ignavibacteriales bacterium]